jgi:hypothetical protein
MAVFQPGAQQAVLNGMVAYEKSSPSLSSETEPSLPKQRQRVAMSVVVECNG